MKLLVFCPYYPPHIGGLESHADEFNKYLSRTGMDITVFTPHLPSSAPEIETRHNNVKIIRFPAFEIIPNYPLPKFWSVKFWRIFVDLFRQEFNIVISRTRFFSTSLMAFKYAKLKRIKWIHIEHGSDFVKLSSGFKTFIAWLYDQTFGRIIFKFSDLNISISKAVQKFVKKFDKRESPIIYRGLELESISKIVPDAEFKKKYEEKIIIAWLGRLYKWKGVAKSIEAIKKLPGEIKEKVIFVVMGEGEDLSGLRKISDSSTIFMGPVRHEEAIGILKVSDIYLHSSDPGGGLSTSLLEAMFCGCAVIATPNEGADEAVENDKNGILIQKSDSDLIADGICLLFSKKQSKFLSTNSKESVIKNFSWNNAIEKYIQYVK